jgi:branched-chain amino acid transport system substrate-binding protein
VVHAIKDISAFSGLNQNYAWGQDSWRDFVAAMKVLASKATVDKVLFPKLFAGEYGAEISALSTSGSQFIHSSFYDGDLEAFVFQASARGLFQRIPVVFTTGEAALLRLGAKMPDGTLIGGRGLNGLLAKDTAFNRWFQQVYTTRYGVPPTYPSYHMAQSLMGLKAAWEKSSIAKDGAKPTTDQVVAAFEGLQFGGPATTLRLALGKGHQGVSGIAYGTYRFNKQDAKPELVDVIEYRAECVNPPEGITAQAWLEGGMQGAKCD